MLDIIKRLFDVALDHGKGDVPLVSFLEQNPNCLGHLPGLLAGKEAVHIASPRRQNARDSPSDGSHVPFLESADERERLRQAVGR